MPAMPPPPKLLRSAKPLPAPLRGESLVTLYRMSGSSKCHTLSTGGWPWRSIRSVYRRSAPKGHRHKAWRFSARKTRSYSQKPRRGAGSSPQQISFIVRNPVALEQRDQLLLERHTLVMLLLGADVVRTFFTSDSLTEKAPYPPAT